MRQYAAIALVVWFALAVFVPAQSRDDTFVIRGVRVFDGTGIAENQSLVIASGRVAAMGTTVDVPPGAIEIPGTGRTVLPGLIDSHVHVGLNSVVEALQQTLAFGVTTVLDMWTTPVYSKWKEIEAADRADLASIRGAGNGATVPGGHPTQMDGGAGRLTPTLSTPAEADAFVAARLAEGSDFIKIIYADQEIFGRKLPTLDEPTIAALVAAAHARGRLAVAHIGGERDARGAIAAGVDGLAHLFVGTTVSPDFGRFVASKGTFVIPTLSVLRWMCGMPDGPAIAQDAEAMRRIRPQFRGLLSAPPPLTPAPSCAAASQAVRQLAEAGVPILAGTDAPVPGSAHGASLHHELEHLVGAGMTPTAALAAATSVPARIFRMTDRGRIAPGLRADLLLVDGDPSLDIRATRRIVAVWKRGVRLEDSSQP